MRILYPGGANGGKGGLGTERESYEPTGHGQAGTRCMVWRALGTSGGLSPRSVRTCGSLSWAA